MCVDSRIVLVLAQRRMSSRTSRISAADRGRWSGSSRNQHLGVEGCSSAPRAMPTRWRKPFDSLPTGLSTISAMRTLAGHALNRRLEAVLPRARWTPAVRARPGAPRARRHVAVEQGRSPGKVAEALGHLDHLVPGASGSKPDLARAAGRRRRGSRSGSSSSSTCRRRWGRGTRPTVPLPYLEGDAVQGREVAVDLRRRFLGADGHAATGIRFGRGHACCSRGGGRARGRSGRTRRPVCKERGRAGLRGGSTM